MSMNRIAAITAVIILALIQGGCKSSGSSSDQQQTYGLPDVSTINAAPSDTFIVSAASLTGGLVTGIIPMPGTESGCYHPGAHVNFASTISLASVDIISPVDGVVTYLSSCYPYLSGMGDADQYKIHISYAQRSGELFTLELGMEPMAGTLCSGAAGTPGYYDPYISVAQGERVTKGQKVGAMVLVPGFSGHIHFNSKYKGIFMCPDIFSSAVINTIDDHYQGSCGTTSFSMGALGTICYQPAPGESHLDY
jgi:hypothetical protein